MNSKEKILEIISSILDIDISKLDNSTTPQDLIEWDSLANMNIFVSLADEINSNLTYEEYSKCSNIGDLLEKFK